MAGARLAAVLVVAALALPASSAAQAEPVVRVQGGEVREGNSGVVDSFFDVFLSVDMHFRSPVEVDYRTEDGTAKAGSDYQATSGTLVFQPGERHKRVRVGVIGDTAHEPDETFLLRLLNVRPGGRIEVAVAEMVIRNDDPKPPVICRCERVRAALGKGKFFAKDTGPQAYFTYVFPVVWAITCAIGTIVDCRGEVKASTTSDDTEIRDARGKPLRGKAIACLGEKCNFTTRGSERVQIRVTGSKKRKGIFLKTKVVRVHLDRRCIPGAAQRTTVTIVFKGSTFDAKASDLNGDGKPDG
jgi:hypothetical protein